MDHRDRSGAGSQSVAAIDLHSAAALAGSFGPGVPLGRWVVLGLR
jgi:hypothetical protein